MHSHMAKLIKSFLLQCLCMCLTVRGNSFILKHGSDDCTSKKCFLLSEASLNVQNGLLLYL